METVLAIIVLIAPFAWGIIKWKGVEAAMFLKLALLSAVPLIGVLVCAARLGWAPSWDTLLYWCLLYVFFLLTQLFGWEILGKAFVNQRTKKKTETLRAARQVLQQTAAAAPATTRAYQAAAAALAQWEAGTAPAAETKAEIEKRRVDDTRKETVAAMKLLATEELKQDEADLEQ